MVSVLQNTSGDADTKNNLHNLFEMEIEVLDIIEETVCGWAVLWLVMTFSTRSAHLLKIKQIKSDELRTRNTGSEPAKSIFESFVYIPVKMITCQWTYTHILLNILAHWKFHTAVEWILTYQVYVVILHAAPGLRSGFIQWESLPHLVLIHVSGRCHSIFHIIAQDFPFSSLFFVMVISKDLSDDS